VHQRNQNRRHDQSHAARKIANKSAKATQGIVVFIVKKNPHAPKISAFFFSISIHEKRKRLIIAEKQEKRVSFALLPHGRDVYPQGEKWLLDDLGDLVNQRMSFNLEFSW
jgi:hypothetical protein